MKLNLIILVLFALILGADAGFFFGTPKSSKNSDKLTKEEKEEHKISKWNSRGITREVKGKKLEAKIKKNDEKTCKQCTKCIHEFPDKAEREAACANVCEQCHDVDEKKYKFDGLKLGDHWKHSLDLKVDKDHMKHSLDLKLDDHLKHSLDLKLDDHLKLHSLDLHMKSDDHMKHSLDLKLDDHLHSLDVHMKSLKLDDLLKIHSLDLNDHGLLH